MGFYFQLVSIIFKIVKKVFYKLYGLTAGEIAIVEDLWK